MILVMSIASYHNNLAPGTQRVDKLLNFFVPMRFWFCKNPGLALPLIALQYHGET